MKKLFTSLAIVALLIGTLTIDANAQNHNRRHNRRTRKAAKTEVITTNVKPEAATIELNAAPVETKKTDVEAKKPEVDAKKLESEVTANPVEAPGAKAVKAVKDTKDVKNVSNSCCKEGDAKTLKTDNKDATPDQKPDAIPEENWEVVIKDYEMAVDDCVTLYKEVKSDEKGSKDLIAKYNESLDNVEALGAKIEKVVKDLPRPLAGRYNQAKQKLSVVYQKG